MCTLYWHIRVKWSAVVCLTSQAHTFAGASMGMHTNCTGKIGYRMNWIDSPVVLHIQRRKTATKTTTLAWPGEKLARLESDSYPTFAYTKHPFAHRETEMNRRIKWNWRWKERKNNNQIYSTSWLRNTNNELVTVEIVHKKMVNMTNSLIPLYSPKNLNGNEPNLKSQNKLNLIKRSA